MCRSTTVVRGKRHAAQRSDGWPAPAGVPTPARSARRATSRPQPQPGAEHHGGRAMKRTTPYLIGMVLALSACADTHRVVIDPGHGGIDTGAIGSTSNTPEKIGRASCREREKIERGEGA